MKTEREFKKLGRVWDQLGTDDPLWAVLSEHDKIGNRWELEEFLETGRKVVTRYAELIETHGGPTEFREVLDFGCGVGRLTLPWTERCALATGVDISAPMIERARLIAGANGKVTYVQNCRPDLSILESNRFDLVFSHICLQHMPWDIAAGYLREFLRVAAPGGIIAFQLPAEAQEAQGWGRFRMKIVDSLPTVLREHYRRWRRGTAILFEMHFTAPEKVAEVMGPTGQLLHKEPDDSAGEATSGFIYIFKKSPAPG